jgi:hypothetical protein
MAQWGQVGQSLAQQNTHTSYLTRVALQMACVS